MKLNSLVVTCKSQMKNLQFLFVNKLHIGNRQAEFLSNGMSYSWTWRNRKVRNESVSRPPGLQLGVLMEIMLRSMNKLKISSILSIREVNKLWELAWGLSKYCHVFIAELWAVDFEAVCKSLRKRFG
ncbi:hypothetical protein QL285_035367 [Trifolium repens]|nr:hypothetical protein QL285_035367 [Trifolium repens]